MHLSLSRHVRTASGGPGSWLTAQASARCLSLRTSFRAWLSVPVAAGIGRCALRGFRITEEEQDMKKERPDRPKVREGTMTHEKHENGVFADLAAFEAKRTELLADLQKEREAAAVRLREIDRAIQTLRGSPPASSPSRRPRGRPRTTEGTMVAQVMNFVTTNPGATSREIKDATGLQWTDVLNRLTRAGRLRSQGSPGSVHRYYPVNGSNE